MYIIEEAKKEHLNKIKKYKLDTILEYASEIEDEEKNKIINYVETEVVNMLPFYKVINLKNTLIGAFCVRKYEDGVLLDEIYLEEQYRSKGIGTNIIKQVLNENKIVYLWVYKDNVKAIKLYENLGFIVEEETETRYFMKFC